MPVGLKPSRKLAGSVIGPKRAAGSGAALVELMSKGSNLVVAPVRGARKPAVAMLIESSDGGIDILAVHVVFAQSEDADVASRRSLRARAHLEPEVEIGDHLGRDRRSTPQAVSRGSRSDE